MLFLIEYDRHRGSIVTFRKFPSSEQHRADDARLQLELQLNRSGVDHEIVVLEAVNEEALRRSHRRYFEDVAGIASTST